MNSVLEIWYDIQPAKYTPPSDIEIESQLFNGDGIVVISTSGIWQFAANKNETANTVAVIRNLRAHLEAPL